MLPTTTNSKNASRPAGSKGRSRCARINWLALVFLAQMAIFVTFICAFFGWEPRSASHISTDQSRELTVLREENIKLTKLLTETLNATQKAAGGEAAVAKTEPLISNGEAAVARVQSDAAQISNVMNDEIGEKMVDQQLEGGMANMNEPVESEADNVEIKIDPDQNANANAAQVDLNDPLAAFSDKCFSLVQEWWNFEVCPFNSVRQVHTPAAGRDKEYEEHSLGLYQRSAPSPAGSRFKSSQTFEGGGPCTKTTSRSTQVQFHCKGGAGSDMVLTSIEEPSTCHYVIHAHTALVCTEQEVSAAKEMEKVDVPPDNTPMEQRAEAVKAAFLHSWKGYKQYAWGRDELRPNSKQANDWIGLGLTILDALDTMLIMKLDSEFKEAKDWVAAHLDFKKPRSVSFFETTIRCLGGLVSAYDLSGEQVFLDKAKDLGDRLLAAFVAPSGHPLTTVNLATGAASAVGWTGGNLLLAEVGTVQLEFFALSERTGDDRYWQKARKVFELIDEHGEKEQGTNGRLFPLYIRPNDGRFSGSQVSFGAMGDSYYEYLLKCWLQTGRTDDFYKRMYQETMRGMIKRLVVDKAGYMYVAESNNGGLVHKMDHLVCFVPAMLALGVNMSAVEGKEAEEHMRIAKGLTHTCYRMYENSPTGLAPEFVRFGAAGMQTGAAHNLLRPEAIEAVTLLYRTTKDPMYREWGWKMFLAFEKHCKIPGGGYSGVRDVNSDHDSYDDTMQTFWLAETLKYFFLLFSPDETLPLDQYVLNTEAHPLKIWKPKAGSNH